MHVHKEVFHTRCMWWARCRVASCTTFSHVGHSSRSDEYPDFVDSRRPTLWRRLWKTDLRSSANTTSSVIFCLICASQLRSIVFLLVLWCRTGALRAGHLARAPVCTLRRLLSESTTSMATVSDTTEHQAETKTQSTTIAKENCLSTAKTRSPAR
jgi:hypothetical protein